MQLRTFKHVEQANKPQLQAKCHTLILVKKSGETMFAGSKKEEVIAEYDEKAGDILIFVWSGQWTSDAFLLTNKDLDKNGNLV